MVQPSRFKGHDRRGLGGGRLLIITSFLTGRQTPVVEQKSPMFGSEQRRRRRGQLPLVVVVFPIFIFSPL